MSLLETIKADQVAIRKSEERSTKIGKMKIKALTTLIGEASPAGNATVTDEQVQAVIVKFVKNLDETISTVDVDHKITSFEQAAESLRDCSDLMLLLLERQLYTSYLPKTFDESDVRDIIESASNLNIGMIMGMCKKAAQEQGKLFNGAIVKAVLAKL